MSLPGAVLEVGPFPHGGRAHAGSQVLPHHLGGTAVCHRVTVVQQDHPFTESGDGGHVVAHEQNRAATLGDLAHPTQTFLLEGGVAYGQHFVHDQDLRFQVRGHGEGQAQIHAGGVALHGSIHEFLDVGKGDDLIELPLDLPRLMPRIAPFRKIFSRPVSSG